MYDIFYVSRNDIVASEWQKIKALYPTAQAVGNVESFSQIRARAFTKMFWVIWDDIELSSSFNLTDYKVTKWDESYTHVFLNGNYYDGLCLFSKNVEVTEKEFKHRFFVNKKEIEVQASVPKPYDIFFISYRESNADENYKKLTDRFPRAKRVHGVKGIHNAHKRAAELSTTDMFWVVDADAIIEPSFNFYIDQIPQYDAYKKSKVYVWRSKNPINDLEYGYGGVKLLPKSFTMNMNMSKIDMTTSISPVFEPVFQVSNISAFNIDGFNSWKSAFRECAKLSSKIIQRQNDKETQERLDTWCTIGKDKPYGEFVVAGAKSGREYGETNKDNEEALKKINDFDWLEQEFNRQYQQYMSKKNNNEVAAFKERLNSISSSFCVAKWKQVTVHLATGQTHSCHHPESHAIPIQEIKIDPSALHNTEFKKSQRKLMLEGVRPKECDYCWKVEDNTQNDQVVSDRIKKSMDYWAIDHLDAVASTSPNESVNPSYLEVSFSNVCNFKCSYCLPDVSSQWLEEVNKHGPYPTSTNFNDPKVLYLKNKYPIPENKHNPYVEAFWQWWPDLYPDLEVLRITGGEPLLTKNTFMMLDYILENPRPELELNINSNLCVPEKIFKKFVEKIARIQEAGAVKSFRMYTSCEAKGKQAEYIRFGLNYNQWIESCYSIMDKVPNANLTIMSTYNALSVSSFKDFLTDMFDLKTAYANERGVSYVNVDIPYLRHPLHQAVNILTEDFLNSIDDQINYMNAKSRPILYPAPGYHDREINSLEIVKVILQDQLLSNKDMSQNRRDFVIFVDEHDRRRGTNFLKTFPEYEEFYKIAKGS
jgi:organic radical activating enzyme